MNKTTTLSSLLILALALSACGAAIPLAATVTAGIGNVANDESSASTAAAQTTTESNSASQATNGLSYPIVDTGQTGCYSSSGQNTPCPEAGEADYGQDAQYSGNQPSYRDNGDGTVSDLVTGLMWQQDAGDKLTFEQAVDGADSFNLAGYDDWRLPTIKELFSLINFDGTDVSCPSNMDCSDGQPFIDTDYFAFEYGDESSGERLIDSQFASSTVYTSTTMNGAHTMFGVNLADGRIKGYGTAPMRGQSEDKGFFVLYVRGSADYGVNDFSDNGNGTITDAATGLTWMQDDSGYGMDWNEALNYCESMTLAGNDDWRLPDIKELQSIVDYSRAPDTTNSAAIDPMFEATQITNEAGQADYGTYWGSTTHINLLSGGGSADYIAFGRAMGYMNGSWMDVHGAGAQRSDPKTGDASDYPTGHGPQGDAVRISNYVRCVTGGVSDEVFTGGEADGVQGSGLPGGGGQGAPSGGSDQGPPSGSGSDQGPPDGGLPGGGPPNDGGGGLPGGGPPNGGGGGTPPGGGGGG